MKQEKESLELRTISREELTKVLSEHLKWINNPQKGAKANLERLDFRGHDLRKVNLSYANLSYSNFSGLDLDDIDLSYAELIGANFSNSNMKGSNLTCADLTEANLRMAYLSKANLESAHLNKADLSFAKLISARLSEVDLTQADITHAYLDNANLWYANLRDARLNDSRLVEANLANSNLKGADLTSADIRFANLRSAELRDAILDNIEYNEATAFFALQCPERGSFTAYKKANGYVVELLIPEDARRSSATTRKCRADKAMVVGIYLKNRSLSNLNYIPSNYDQNFVYNVGKPISVDDFDENRWNECSTGIHFFMTFDEAKNY